MLTKKHFLKGTIRGNWFNFKDLKSTHNFLCLTSLQYQCKKLYQVICKVGCDRRQDYLMTVRFVRVGLRQRNNGIKRVSFSFSQMPFAFFMILSMMYGYRTQHWFFFFFQAENCNAMINPLIISTKYLNQKALIE